MASNWATFVDALVADLTVEVAALRDVLVHRYTPWDPSSLVTESGERHLAVHPSGDAVVAEPLTTGGGGSNELVEVYQIRYWEDAGDESSRAVADEEAAAQMFEVAQAIQDRLHTMAVQTLGGAFHVRYVGCEFPDRSSSVRWFLMTLQARRAKDIT